MFKKINFTQRNRLLPLLAGVGLLLCWILAFGKTFDAIRLNMQLKEQASAANDISFNPIYTQRKLGALENILKSYQVKEENWHDVLWMKASAAAVKQSAAIDYTIYKPLEKDTTSAGISQSLYCYGSFVQLLKVVDTLERTPGIGKLSALQFKGPKAELLGRRGPNGEGMAQCVLRLDFRAIENKDIR